MCGDQTDEFPSTNIACPALDYLWIVAIGFQLRVGFALDGPDLLGAFVLCRPIFSLLCKLHEISKLIFTKIVKIVATRCQISRLKCTKFDFGWGSAPTDYPLPRTAPPLRPFGPQYSRYVSPPLPGCDDLPESRGARINTGIA